MGVSFTDLFDDSASVRVKFKNGKELTVNYDPQKLSPAYMKRVAKAIDEANAANEEDGGDADPMILPKLFCAMVTGWSMEGPIGEGEFAVEAGQPVPLEPDYVAWVPAQGIQYIIEQIGADANPNPQKRRDSSRR